VTDDEIAAELAETLAVKFLHVEGNPTRWCQELATACVPTVRRLIGAAHSITDGSGSVMESDR
jgi:hypothetical protein